MIRLREVNVSSNGSFDYGQTREFTTTRSEKPQKVLSVEKLTALSLPSALRKSKVGLTEIAGLINMPISSDECSAVGIEHMKSLKKGMLYLLLDRELRADTPEEPEEERVENTYAADEKQEIAELIRERNEAYRILSLMLETRAENGKDQDEWYDSETDTWERVCCWCSEPLSAEYCYRPTCPGRQARTMLNMNGIHPGGNK